MKNFTIKEKLIQKFGYPLSGEILKNYSNKELEEEFKNQARSIRRVLRNEINGEKRYFKRTTPIKKITKKEILSNLYYPLLSKKWCKNVIQGKRMYENESIYSFGRNNISFI